jgi:putative lipoic acid-binding regulatory protein
MLCIPIKVLDYFLQVNTYPGQRTFKAIGVGGSDFVQSMVGAVETAVGSPIHEESVQHRLSARGSYISVTIGPVIVQNRDQVSFQSLTVLTICIIQSPETHPCFADLLAQT